MLNVRALRRREPIAGTGIGAEDVRLLVDLAAQQIRYGQPEEALLLLRLCQTFAPEDPRTVFVSAQAFAAIEEWDAADAMLAAHRRMVGERAGSAAERLLAAVVARARRRFDAAAGAFADYLAAVSGGMKA